MSRAFASACLAALSAASTALAEPSATFRNPVVPGFAPDPSVCRVGEDFYLANSSFTMRPGLPIYHSRDLAHWDLIGYAAGADADASFAGSTTDGGIYAPTLRSHDGTFYLIVKNTTSGHNELYSTRDPAGSWSAPQRIGPDWDDDIDPDLFFDDDGGAYVARRIGHVGDGSKAEQFAWHFDPATARITSDKFPVWNGTGQHIWPEGGHLYRFGDYYYYQLAEGGTEIDHRVTIARKPVGKGLDDLSQQWEPCPTNPIVFNDPKKNPQVFATGHADLTRDSAGHWWMVLLGRRDTPRPDLGRETYLAPVEWRDGWPIVNGGNPITTTMTAPVPLPGGDATTQPSRTTHDEFDAPTLALPWNLLREIVPATYSLGDRPGSLTLHGTANGLDSKDRVAWVGRRLLDKSVRVTTTLDFAPAVDGQAAGLNLFGKIDDYDELIVRRAEGRREAVVRIRTAAGETTSDAVALPGEAPVRLELTIEHEQIIFRCSSDDGATWRTVRSVAARDAISLPGFAGLYVAMHAVGDGATAHFDRFDYEPLAQ